MSKLGAGRCFEDDPFVPGGGGVCRRCEFSGGGGTDVRAGEK